MLGHSGESIRFCHVDVFWRYPGNTDVSYLVTQDAGDAYAQIRVTSDAEYIICSCPNQYGMRLAVINESGNIRNVY